MVQVLQLLEVLVLEELSPTVENSVIHPLALSLTPPRLLLPPSNHRVLPLKRERLVRRPTSLSPHLRTVPPLTLAPGTQPPVRLTHTPLAHRHSLRTRFVARERLERHTRLGEAGLMRCLKGVVPTNSCLDYAVVEVDLLRVQIHSLEHPQLLPAQLHQR